MGRPIKKGFIGNVSTSGQQVACWAYVYGDSTSRLSWIHKQDGTGRYYVVSDDGEHEGMVTLANIDGGNLTVGQASVTVTPFFDPGPKYAEVIYDNVVKTFDGDKYIWYFEGITTDEVNGANIQSD